MIEKVKLLTLHEDGGVGVQRLSKHNILCLKTPQRTTQSQSCDMFTSSTLQVIQHIIKDLDTFSGGAKDDTK